MRVGVIGGGLMGSGIAEVCARAGVDVTIVEADRAAIDHLAHRPLLRKAAPLEQDVQGPAASAPHYLAPTRKAAKGPGWEKGQLR